jgi:hypothetical protein
MRCKENRSGDADRTDCDEPAGCFPWATAPGGTLDAMATAKQDARRVLDGLPEEASLEDIQYHLYVLQRIRRGCEDVRAARVLPQDEVEQRLARWLDE